MVTLDENNSADRESLRRYFTVFQTVMTMMFKRNKDYQSVSHLIYTEQAIEYVAFDIHPLDFVDMKFRDFLDYRAQTQTALFQNRFEFSSYWLHEDGSNTMLLFLPALPGKEQVDVEVYSKIIAKMISIEPTVKEPQLNKFHHFILLSEKGLNPVVKNRLKIYPDVHFETYKDSAFAMDVTEHCLAPVSVVEYIKKSGVDKWEDEEDLVASKQHNIRENDPFAIMYGAKIGDVMVLTTMGGSHNTRIEYKITTPAAKIEPPKIK